MEWGLVLMLATPELETALTSARLIATHGPWTRALMNRHLLTRSARLRPLWGGAARMNGALFTPKESFDSIYLAWDAVTAFAEVQALILLSTGRMQAPTPPLVVMTVNGVVSCVLDLTDPKIRTQLCTNEQELSGFWGTGAEPPTQRLGRASFESGRIAGIKSWLRFFSSLTLQSKRLSSVSAILNAFRLRSASLED